MLGGNVVPIEAYSLHTSCCIPHACTTNFLQLTGKKIKRNFPKKISDGQETYKYCTIGIILYQFLSSQKNTPSIPPGKDRWRSPLPGHVLVYQSARYFARQPNLGVAPRHRFFHYCWWFRNPIPNHLGWC